MPCHEGVMVTVHSQKERRVVMPKKAVIAVPKSLNEAAQFLAEIGQEQRATDKIHQASMPKWTN